MLRALWTPLSLMRVKDKLIIEKLVWSWFFSSGGHVPFRLGVHFDDFELDGGTGADAMDALNEMSGAPGGIIGFKLQFSQVTCTSANFG